MSAALAGRLLKSRFRVLLILLVFQSVPATADIARVAVASNFKPTLHKLLEAFSARSNHQFRVSSASTGMLYAQIIKGAPFDIFLAGDRVRPELLEESGSIEPGSRRTYAVGQLALWVPGAVAQVDRHFLAEFSGILAIANPEIAPYGIAAMELLDQHKQQRFKLVRGNNVAQAFQFVRTGNAEAGLVALSQIMNTNVDSRFFWRVSQDYHTPIEQQLVILKPTNAGQEFVNFLATDEAWRILSGDGYTPPRREGDSLP